MCGRRSWGIALGSRNWKWANTMCQAVRLQPRARGQHRLARYENARAPARAINSTRRNASLSRLCRRLAHRLPALIHHHPHREVKVECYFKYNRSTGVLHVRWWWRLGLALTLTLQRLLPTVLVLVLRRSKTRALQCTSGMRAPRVVHCHCLKA